MAVERISPLWKRTFPPAITPGEGGHVCGTQGKCYIDFDPFEHPNPLFCNGLSKG